MELEQEWLTKLSEQLKTQDNLGTKNPMFIVEQKIRDYGYDSDYCDDYIWMNEDNEEATGEEAIRLEKLEDECEPIPEGWWKGYYKDRWEFVTACLTRQGCLDYLALDGHNIKEARIYVVGNNRNHEWTKIREFFIGED